MIVSLRTKSYKELKDALSKDEKILLYSCNLCIKLCNNLGGKDALENLAAKLTADGYNVIHTEPIGYGCHFGLVNTRKRGEATKDLFKEADVIVTIICTDGHEKLMKIFKKKKIIATAETVGIGMYSTEEGMRLVCPFPETGLRASKDGIPLNKAAKKLKMYHEPF
ncbi:MAG: hypothetical protein ACFFBD_13595 [Candidatus Hodarchaeota archaeon]